MDPLLESASEVPNLCANCMSTEDSTTVKVITVNSKVVKVYEALQCVYGVSSFPSAEDTEEFDDYWQLCNSCSDILLQLYVLYLRFKDIGREGSRIDTARSKSVLVVAKEEPLPVLPDTARLRRRILRDRRPPSGSDAWPGELDPDTFPLSVKQETSHSDAAEDDDWVPPSPEVSFHAVPPKKRGRGRPRSNKVHHNDKVGVITKNKKRGRPKRFPAAALSKFSIILKSEAEDVDSETLPKRKRRSRSEPKVAKVDSGSDGESGEEHADDSKETAADDDDTDGNSDANKSKRSNSDSDFRPKKRGRPRGSKKYGGLLPKVKLHDDKTYECPQCGKKSKSMRNLHIHIRGVHEGLRPYPCPVCKRQFAGKDGLKNHLRVTHGELGTEEVRKYVCEEPGCGKSFAYSAVLRAHRFTHNKDELRFVCPTCGRKYRSNHDMQRHMTVHTDDKPVVCDQCGGTFKTNSNLAQHQRFVHPDVFGGLPLSRLSCHICLKTFMTPGNMRQHVRSVHERVKPHQCQLCEKQFSCSSNLKVHLKGFHKQGQNVIMNTIVTTTVNTTTSPPPPQLAAPSKLGEDVLPIPIDLAAQSNQIMPLQQQPPHPEMIEQPPTTTNSLSTVDNNQFQHYSFPFFHSILPH